MIDSTISGAPTQRWRAKKRQDQAIGHSRGGPSTKIDALADALGNPLAFLLTGGQAHDLAGADALLPAMADERLIADKAFDADARVLESLGRQIGCHPTAARPPVATRIRPGAPQGAPFDRKLLL
ncbi:MAG: transposase [Alphaproteobacteria bacterium]|nr:transposase [Alphaproteobacteria bacterium]